MNARLEDGLRREMNDEMEREILAIDQLINAEGARTATAEAPRPNLAKLGASSAAATPAAAVIETSGVNRRSLLKSAALMGGLAVVAGPLQMFGARRAYGSPIVANPYGAPVPTADLTTGLNLIGLPPGFRYYSYGWRGDPISPRAPAILTPSLHDGMDVVREVGNQVIVCRNHETSFGTSYYGGSIQYSPGGGGGNTNIIFNRLTERWERGWASLSGTVRNCAGGRTLHNSWLSCEETGGTSGPGGAFTHGWVFDVPATGLATGDPLKSMGRRSHEAAAVDPLTPNIVYLTEDGSPGGVYRWIANNPADFMAGGTLQMLRVPALPQANLRGVNPIGGGGAPYPVAANVPLAIDWVTIADPENLVSPSNFSQGIALGGAAFRRPEGAWAGPGYVYFVSTDGGIAGQGQVFVIDTVNQSLILLLDSPTADELDNPDNLTVTPQGSLLFCEDNSGNPFYAEGGVSTERLVIMKPSGETFTFATNKCNFSPSGLGSYTRPGNPNTFNSDDRAQEWAGACFDSTGKWLFANIQTPGITFAITGPWENGPI